MMKLTMNKTELNNKLSDEMNALNGWFIRVDCKHIARLTDELNALLKDRD